MTQIYFKQCNFKSGNCKCNKKKKNTNQKQAAVAILDKTDFKKKAVIRDKENRYGMIQGSIQQEDTI